MVGLDTVALFRSSRTVGAFSRNISACGVKHFRISLPIAPEIRSHVTVAVITLPLSAVAMSAVLIRTDDRKGSFRRRLPVANQTNKRPLDP
jgi:hypothetical protein